MKSDVYRQIFENTQISNFMKIYRVETELFYADVRTDMTKLIVAFCSFAKAPKKERGNEQQFITKFPSVLQAPLSGQYSVNGC
jgi:ADP-ribose pyrophosphatase YjhB (NUDIX family)